MNRATYLLIKRLADVSLAGFLLVLLAPVMLGTTLLIRWRLGSPVLFRQLRAGQGGRPFTLYKFRTMSDLRDPQGNLLPDAQRLPRFGQWLRKWSLDELPQLWNVIRGDMSLVGPRPLLLSYVERYSPRQRRRLDVRPGITGWAQVTGRNTLEWDEKFERDVWYTEHASLWLDAWILLLTGWAVLWPQGVSAADHATMPEFQGSAANAAVSRPPSPTASSHQSLESCSPFRVPS